MVYLVLQSNAGKFAARSAGSEQLKSVEVLALLIHRFSLNGKAPAQKLPSLVGRFLAVSSCTPKWSNPNVLDDEFAAYEAARHKREPAQKS
jgi:hypothetical protein